MDRIGIVTVTYNSAKVLSSFLDCLWSQNYINFILYVIDNASTDNSINLLKQVKDSRLRIIINKDNIGVAAGNNIGIKQALSDECHQLLIMNNDIEFEYDMIDRLVRIQELKKCSLVTPKIMYYDSPNHIWYAGSWFSKRKGYVPYHRGIDQLDQGDFNNSIIVNYAPTCCLLIKKKVFEDIGLMDEKYFVYFDDTDFLYRIYKDKRHKLYYVPTVKILHKVGSLTKSFTGKEKLYRGDFFLKYTFRNHIYFLKKIGGFFAYLFIIWLFFKNNIRFFINPRIKKNISTLLLINRSYFEGLKM